MYSFLIDTVTNYHNLAGLKQPKLIILTVLEVRPKMKLGLNQAVGRAAFLSGGSRGLPVFLLFQASKGCLHFLAGGPFLQLQNHHLHESFPLCLAQILTLLLPLSHLKDPFDYIGTTR